MNSVRSVLARTSDGWCLRGEVLAEHADARFVVILLHAMMASRKTMDRPRGAGLGSCLAARGHTVLAFDLRGHGESGPSAREGARYTYDDYVLRDVPAIVAFVRESFPKQRVVIVGHSLGAHTSLAMAGVFPDQSPDALVSIAGNMWLPSCEPNGSRRWKKAAMLQLFLRIAETWGYFDPRPLRMGTDAVALPYVRQFWRMWSADRFDSTDGTIDYRKNLANITFPVLSVTSEADTLLAHPASVELFLSPIAERYKTLRVVKNGPDHMGLVTDVRSRVVWQEIADWIDNLD